MDEFEPIESVNEEEPVLETEVTEEVSEVSDADLDAAFQQFMGNEVIEETEEVEEVGVIAQIETVPQVSHPEASKLGRKVKYIEDKMVSKEEFSHLNSKIDSLLEQLNRKPIEPEYDEYGHVVEKPVDIDVLVEEKIVQREVRKQQEFVRANQQYQDGYAESLRDLISEIDDPVLAKEVFKKMTDQGSPYNVRLSMNPYTDASKNFVRAVKSVQTPFSGKRGSNVPTGVTTTSVTSTPQRKAPKLDAEAASYAKEMGLTADEIFDALDGDVPDRLRGTKLKM